MARINRISITLCALLFTTLPLTPMAHASKQARESSATTHITKKADKKKSTATTKKTQKTAKKAASKSTTKSKTASSVKKSSITASKNAKTRSKHAVNKTASASFTEKCTKRKGYKSHCVKVKNAASGTLADAHKAKVQKATKVAMNKLMQQIGKPYRWGGSSPRTGFDCSGLVYYAYKDLVKIRIPRTANEMYHLRDAVNRLQRNCQRIPLRLHHQPLLTFSLRTVLQTIYFHNIAQAQRPVLRLARTSHSNRVASTCCF